MNVYLGFNTFTSEYELADDEGDCIYSTPSYDDAIEYVEENGWRLNGD